MNIFITSTDTGIGKTFVTESLIKKYRSEKIDVMAIKPVISGFKLNDIENDLYKITSSLNLNYKQNYKKICLHHFKKPLSPCMASRLEKTPEVNFQNLLKFIKSFKSKILLIEGAGGLMVPLNSKKTTLDLIEKTADKVILVCGSYLGSLSHTLTALEVLSSRNLNNVEIYLNQNLSKNNPLYIDIDETEKSLKNFTKHKIIKIPFNKN